MSCYIPSRSPKNSSVGWCIQPRGVLRGLLNGFVCGQYEWKHLKTWEIPYGTFIYIYIYTYVCAYIYICIYIHVYVCIDFFGGYITGKYDQRTTACCGDFQEMVMIGACHCRILYLKPWGMCTQIRICRYTSYLYVNIYIYMFIYRYVHI